MTNDQLTWLIAAATAASLNSLQTGAGRPLKIATLSSEYRGCLTKDPAIVVARAASFQQISILSGKVSIYNATALRRQHVITTTRPPEAKEHRKK